jgi:hypothetical protein
VATNNGRDLPKLHPALLRFVLRGMGVEEH